MRGRLGWDTAAVLPTPKDLDTSVVWSVIRAAHVLEREVSALFAAFELSAVQFGVLAYLSTGGPMTTADLARSVLVRPQSIVGVIDNLEARNLVVRQGPRGRGRASPVALSPAGERLLAQVWPAFTASNQASALGLRADQVMALTETVHALLAAKEAAQA